MRRFLKISGTVTGSLAVIMLVLSVSVLIGNYMENGRKEEMYADLFRRAIPFSADAEDSLDLHFRYVSDSLWQSRIIECFNLDSEGAPLALSEMREYYIAGKEMKICPLLDRHNVNCTYYRAYRVKNLYWFF